MNEHAFFYHTTYHSPSEMAKKFLFFVQDVGWYKCQPDYHMNRTFYYYQIKFVVRGNGYVIYNGRKFRADQHKIFFLDLNRPHEYYTDPTDPWELLWVRFGGIQCHHFFELLRCDKNPIIHVRNPSRIQQLMHTLYDLFQKRPLGVEVVSSSTITQILTEMTTTKMEGSIETNPYIPSRYQKEVQEAIDYIAEHYHQRIRTEDIAHAVHLSPFYFSRIFKRSTGCTVNEYVIKFRLQQAKFLMAHSDRSLGEIAHDVGFASQSYFSKVFKELENMSPNEYRRNIQ